MNKNITIYDKSIIYFYAILKLLRGFLIKPFLKKSKGFLFVGKKVGFILGIVFGIILDFLLGQAIGVSAFLLALIGLGAEYLDRSFSKDSRIMLMLIVIAGTVFFETGYYIFKILKYGAIFEFVPFIKILIIEIIFNLILTIILYPLIQKMGNKLEDIFKRKKILSRYY